MKKLLFLILGATLTAGAMAQTPQDPGKEKEMKNLRSNVRTRKTERHQVNKDVTHAKLGQAVHDHKAVAHTNRAIHRNKKVLQNEEVSHPVAKAKRQVKVQDDNKKDGIKQ